MRYVREYEHYTKYNKDETYLFYSKGRYDLSRAINECIEICKLHKCKIELNYCEFVFMLDRKSKLNDKLQVYNDYLKLIKNELY